MRTFPLELQTPAPPAAPPGAAGAPPQAHLFYFKNVRNAPALRARLVARDPKADFAMLDARTV
ncbi:MAG: hypothetical protein BJ554DRAFT_6731, partial [Olpidium bornovanus]